MLCFQELHRDEDEPIKGPKQIGSGIHGVQEGGQRLTCPRLIEVTLTALIALSGSEVRNSVYGNPAVRREPDM